MIGEPEIMEIKNVADYFSKLYDAYNCIKREGYKTQVVLGTI